MLLHLSDLHTEIVLDYLSRYIVKQCLLIKMDSIAQTLILDFKSLEMFVCPYHSRIVWIHFCHLTCAKNRIGNESATANKESKLYAKNQEGTLCLCVPQAYQMA